MAAQEAGRAALSGAAEEAVELGGCVASQMGDIFDEKAIMSLPESELTGVIRQPASIGPAVRGPRTHVRKAFSGWSSVSVTAVGSKPQCTWQWSQRSFLPRP